MEVVAIIMTRANYCRSLAYNSFFVEQGLQMLINSISIGQSRSLDFISLRATFRTGSLFRSTGGRAQKRSNLLFRVRLSENQLPFVVELSKKHISTVFGPKISKLKLMHYHKRLSMAQKFVMAINMVSSDKEAKQFYWSNHIGAKEL